MPKRKTIEEKYLLKMRKQQQILVDFAAHESEWAGDLMYWYKLRKEEIADDEYRACVFFLNKEYLRKPGSLTMLYEMYLRCNSELPEATKENAFDLLRYRYKAYAKTLKTGGYDGRSDW